MTSLHRFIAWAEIIVGSILAAAGTFMLIHNQFIDHGDPVGWGVVNLLGILALGAGAMLAILGVLLARGHDWAHGVAVLLLIAAGLAFA